MCCMDLVHIGLMILGFSTLILTETDDPRDVEFLFLNHEQNKTNPASMYQEYVFEDTKLPNTIDPPFNQTVLYSIPKNASLITIGGLFGITDVGTGSINMKGLLEAGAFIESVLTYNKDPTILPDTSLEYIVVDGQNDHSATMRGGFVLLGQEIVSVVGLENSGDVYTTYPIFSTSNMPIVSGSVIFEDIYNESTFPTFFRTIPGLTYISQAMADLCSTMGWDAISYYAPINVTVYELINALAANNIDPECGSGQLFLDNPMTIPDFSACVARGSSDVVLLWGMEFEAIVDFASVIKQNPNNTNVVFVFPCLDKRIASLRAEKFSQLDGSIALLLEESRRHVSRSVVKYITPEYVDTYHFLAMWETTFRCSLYGSSFMTAFFSRKDIDPDNGIPSISGYSRLDTAEHPVCSSNDIDSRSVDISCRCTGNETLPVGDIAQGPNTVEYVIDATDTVILALDQLVNKCEYLHNSHPSLCHKNNFSAIDLTEAIQASDFEGVTGRVQFRGTSRANGIIDYFQYQQANNQTWRPVGNYTAHNAYINKGLLRFNDGTSTHISTINPIDFALPNVYTAVFFGIADLLILCSLGLIIFFIIYRNHVVVANSGLLFLVSLLVGNIIAMFAQIVKGLPVNAATCFIQQYILALGLIIIRAALLGKMFVSLFILANVHVRRPPVFGTSLFVFILIPALFYTAYLLIIYGFYGFPKPLIFSLEHIYYIYCGNESPKIAIFVNIAYVLELTLIVIFTLASFLTVALYSPNQENTFISLALTNFLIVIGIFVPILVSITDLVEEYLFTGILVSYLGISNILIIAVPKLIAMRRSSGETSKIRGYDSSTPSEIMLPSNPS